MVIQFKNIKFHNFCSYADADLNLCSKGYCLVSGRNNYKRDSALSNGSGKSTIWSAICFALTGETIAGLKTNLKNKNIDENDCSVCVTLSVDNDDYVITRYIAPKSDLKIVKNGDDISGKGIRESERVLSENLPDLTKDLIASTIILGQGMPNKLSSFSPSGRKDLLEKLTKSDFMIEDIKERISERQAELNTQLRSHEDSLLVNNTKLNSLNTTKEKLDEDLNNMTKLDFDALINAAKSKAEKALNVYNETNSTISALEKACDAANDKILALTASKASESDEELKQYLAVYNKYLNDKSTLQTNIDFLNQEILKLNSIKDVCPTCGQKIPGVLKPDTTEQSNKLIELGKEIEEIDKKLADVYKVHIDYTDAITKKYSEINDIQIAVKNDKTEITRLKTENANANQKLTDATNELHRLEYDKDNTDKVYSSLKKKLDECNADIHLLENTIRITNLAKTNLEEHIAVVRKIDSLVKRDFRGYLLYNIIEYLNNKTKEYSRIVFNHDDIEIYLDGNALDISYCGKLYESLSGGEKQRVDVITQFAIRELLQTYFNYSSNILVLDEITDNLDRIATARIFELITNKLNDVESVFIISHHDSELEIPVDSEIHIIKDENSISSIKEIK